jgi:hypothetical protein
MNSTNLQRAIDSVSGLYPGFMVAMHQVPAGARVLESKQCENCTRTFTRPIKPKRPVIVRNQASDESEFSMIFVDTGVKYCPRCLGNMLLPEEQETYKDQLPTEGEMKHSNHLPRYDRSLVQPGSNLHKMQTRCRSAKKDLGNWQPRLRQAFVEKLVMSAKEIHEVIGSTAKSFSMAVGLARSVGFRFIEVGNVWPRPSCMGVCPKLYRML